MNERSKNDSRNQMKIPVLFILLSGLSALLALNHYGFIYHGAVAVFGGIAVLVFYAGFYVKNRDLWFIIAAFVFSILGDWFLSNRQGDDGRFVLGILLYFLAHLGYLGYSLYHGRLPWLFTGVVLLGYLAFYFMVLVPAITNQTLALATLLYLLISCLSLGAAVGTRLSPISKNLLILGVGLILFSDTIIAFKEFVKYSALNFLILPTYFLAQISISLSLLMKNTER